MSFFGLYLRDLDSIFGVGGSRITKDQVFVIPTLLAGMGALFVILAKRYDQKDKHWAYATVGALLGFWLHLQRA